MQIVLLGASGRLGQRIVLNLEEKKIKWIPLQRTHLNFYENFEKFLREIKEPTLFLDVSLPEASVNCCEYLLKYFSLHTNSTSFFTGLIIGTTGHKEKKVFLDLSRHMPLCLVSNFSKGVFLFEQILSAQTGQGKPLKDLFTELGFEIRMNEVHHIHKKDAPSGTALTLAEKIQFPIEKITSDRQGDVIGVHSVQLVADSEELMMTHSAFSRDLFASGAVDLCLKFFHKKPVAGFYNKDFFWM